MKSVEAEECYYDVTNHITFFAEFLKALKSVGSLNIAAKKANFESNFNKKSSSNIVN